MSFVTPPASSPGARSGPPLGYLLRQAAAQHRLSLERALADLDVTPPQFLVLRMLATQPGSSNAELARRAALTTPTVTVIVTKLVRRGAVASRAHELHGRVRPLDLTPAGADLLTACEQRAAGVEAALEAGLAPVDTALVARWLMRAAGLSPPSQRV